MADIFTKSERSKIMRQVKSKRNKTTEIKLIEYFRSNGIIGWRRNYKLFGKPDFVFPKKRVVIFTDGCFWHGHNCRNLKPENNKEYWQKKIARNKLRDKVVTKNLKKRNWIVIRIWECEIRNLSKLENKLSQILQHRNTNKPVPSLDLN